MIDCGLCSEFHSRKCKGNLGDCERFKYLQPEKFAQIQQKQLDRVNRKIYEQFPENYPDSM